MHFTVNLSLLFNLDFKTDFVIKIDNHLNHKFEIAHCRIIFGLTTIYHQTPFKSLTVNIKSLKSHNAPDETLTVRILSQLHLLLQE